MFSTGPDQRQKPFQIKQDGKFFSSLLTKESSTASPSFRVYYGEVSVAVPFIWESQPGKPKYKKLCENTLPPLAPPPSYYSSSHTKPIKKHSRSSILRVLFPRIIVKKANASTLPSTNSASSTLSPSPSSASRSSLISSGSPSPAPRKYRGQSLGLLFDSGTHDEDPPSGSPT